MEKGETRKTREDCPRTKHDIAFSNWEVLVGPSDWKNYSLGKDGVERYRLHNLPVSCSCPGLYELGIATIPTDLGRKIRELDPKSIIVVYLGQADNVRTRLQHYGRAGSHLDRGNSITLSNECVSPYLERGPGLFREVFSRGFPIVFRWAPMKNKMEAEKTEANLLKFFDYAWNKGGNGARRQSDILLKLDEISLGKRHSVHIAKFSHWLRNVFLGEKHEGLSINASIPLKEMESNGNQKHNLQWRLLKFSKTRPQIVRGCDVLVNGPPTCGVSLGNGSVCGNKPIEGRKRCDMHKGKRINGSSHATKDRKPLHCAQSTGVVNEYDNICGIPFGDGGFCRTLCSEGRKRCNKHKGMRISCSTSGHILLGDEKYAHESGNCIQGEGLSDDDISPFGVPLRTPRVKKWREENNGKKINARTCLVEGKSDICGASLENGSICMDLPVRGRKRCKLHKGKRVALMNIK